MQTFIIEILLVINLFLAHGDPRFHQHNPIKKISSHTRTNKTSIKPANKDLCSGNSKHDAAMIKQFYANTFTLFKKEKPGCVCIQLCKGKPAYCYPDGCFYSLGGCPHKTKVTTNLPLSSTLSSTTFKTSEIPIIRDNNSTFENTPSRNSLSTQGDFDRKVHIKFNKEGRDLIKKRENDSFSTNAKEREVSKEIPAVLEENYPLDSKIPKLIDKDYTQWPKSKLYRGMSRANVSEWNLEESPMDDIATISQIPFLNSSSSSYLTENKAKVPSYLDFKQQFEILSNSQQMPVFDDFFVETKETMVKNLPASATTVNMEGSNQGSILESNDYFQKVVTNDNNVKKLVPHNQGSVTNDRHVGDFISYKQDVTHENVKDEFEVEAFSELYNNYVKRFDTSRALSATFDPMVDSDEYSKLPKDTYNTPYIHTSTANQYDEFKQPVNITNQKAFADSNEDDFSVIAPMKSTAGQSNKLSNEDFNVIFNNYYGVNHSTIETEVNNFIKSSNTLSTTSPHLFPTTSSTTYHKRYKLFENVSYAEENRNGTDPMMASASNFFTATIRPEQKTKQNYLYRDTAPKSESYKRINGVFANHKTTPTVSQVKFSNDYAQLKHTDIRPTSQIYSTLDKYTRQNKYRQKERRVYIEPKRPSHASIQYHGNITQSEININAPEYSTQSSRNELQVKAKNVPFNTNRHSRRKHTNVSKN